MSKDTIYREDAMALVNKLVCPTGNSDYDEGRGTERESIKESLMALPSADRPQEWIPCSERLPEYRKLVLVTTRDLRVKPAYLDSIQDDGTDDWWSIPLDDADCALWNIVAWMPLPKPWEGADDE